MTVKNSPKLKIQTNANPRAPSTTNKIEPTNQSSDFAFWKYQFENILLKFIKWEFQTCAHQRAHSQIESTNQSPELRNENVVARVRTSESCKMTSLKSFSANLNLSVNKPLVYKTWVSISRDLNHSESVTDPNWIFIGSIFDKSKNFRSHVSSLIMTQNPL